LSLAGFRNTARQLDTANNRQPLKNLPPAQLEKKLSRREGIGCGLAHVRVKAEKRRHTMSSNSAHKIEQGKNHATRNPS
jgi:hypothetical protein